jgi:tetratricopeptide (TPR) repeat protein
MEQAIDVAEGLLGASEAKMRMIEAWRKGLVEAMEAQPGGCGLDLAKAKAALGFHLDSAGDFVGALKFYGEALHIWRKELGDEQCVDVAKTHNNIGMVYDSQGKYADALSSYDKSLQIKIKALGHDHVDVANTQYNMAIVYRTQGNKKEARRLFLRCSEIYSKVYGSQHSETTDAVKQASRC